VLHEAGKRVPEGREMSEPLRPRRPEQPAQRRPLRPLDMMAVVAAVAMAFVIPPNVFWAIIKPPAGMIPRDGLNYEISLALSLSTLLIALIAVIANLSQSRWPIGSYGTSAVFAAAAAIFLHAVQGLGSALFWLYYHGFPIFQFRDSYYSHTTWRFVEEAPAGAAAAIAAVWLILALTGAGQRPSGWFETFCFYFGPLWVLWFLGRDFMLLIPGY
jgi:hypothetical protein